MQDGSFIILNAEDEAQVVRYERAFYDAFIVLRHNRLIHKIWDWDHEKKRLKTRIPYECQILFAWISAENRLMAGWGINTSGDHFQAGAFGFSPRAERGTWCEGIAFFTVEHYRIPGHLFARSFLRGFCYPELARRGFRMLYTTCAEKPLPAYLRMGLTLIEQTVIEDQARYFLELDLGPFAP